MASPAETAREKASVRNAWALSAPALVVLTFAACGPLLIMLVYSVLTEGEYGNVEWIFSTEGWRSMLYSEDIFDPGVFVWADAHLTIFWRSVRLSVLTTVLTLLIIVTVALLFYVRVANRERSHG